MRRREFILALASVPVVGAVWAQVPGRQFRIALVHSGIVANQLTEAAGPFWVRRFFERLRALGYVEGRNLIVERYSAEGRVDQFSAIAHAVVISKPDVIVANSNSLVRAFLATTAMMPIVAIIGDPLQTGLVKSLARPGANLTGVTIDAGPEIYTKQLEIVREAIPPVTKIAFLVSRAAWESTYAQPLRDAAHKLGIPLVGIAPERVDESQIRSAFAEMIRQQSQAVIISSDGNFLAHRDLIVELAEHHGLAAMYPYRDYVEIGGLMAYAPDLGELAAYLANDVDRILNGTEPGEISIYQPTKFELVVNIKTAKAQGISVPQSVLLRADEVIE